MCHQGTCSLRHRLGCLDLRPHERRNGNGHYWKYGIEDDAPIEVMRYVPVRVRSLICYHCSGRIMLMTDLTAFGLMREYRCVACARVPATLEPAPLSLVGAAVGEGFRLHKQAKCEYESQLPSTNGNGHTGALP